MQVVHDVTFGVPAAGTTALLGRNGAGKTTTLRAVLGLTAATGRVTLAGIALHALPTHARIGHGIGYVPEDRGVFAALTVAENLRLAAPEATGADYDRVYALFPDLATRSRQLAGTLSGGQQQMVALGRVLLRDNRILLVDEPTKGLAPRVVTEVAQVLARVAETVPILLVEQNLAVVRRLAHRAVALANGTVAWQGDPGDLADDTDLAHSLLGVA
ncbi:MAG: ABC transporter ATP-binding protein [Hamadaea sp.]|nr:ABC transporter ATP-binding protein [Hamadaea sp.]